VTQQLSDVSREKDVQVHDLQQRLSEVTQQLSDVSREKEVQVHEKEAQIQHLQQRISTTLLHTHSQEIEFWRVSAKEVQVDQRVLGRGAWGYVTRGIFRGQQVAVKKVYPDILKPHTVDRIHREISTMAQVRHPNLVLFIAAVLDDRTGPMIITEILNTSLRTAYEKNRLGSNNKLRVFRDVASALNYLHLHREPIIHRESALLMCFLKQLPTMCGKPSSLILAQPTWYDLPSLLAKVPLSTLPQKPFPNIHAPAHLPHPKHPRLMCTAMAN